MSLRNTTGREDEFLANPEEYPAEVFGIAKRLDEKITDQIDELDQKDKEIDDLKTKIETLEEQVAELERGIADLELQTKDL